MAEAEGASSGDYVLGTNREELERLGLQHRVWRPYALEAFRQGGLSEGGSVLDVGAGPGFATRDLAEIVGPAGHVDAVERSERFFIHLDDVCSEFEFVNAHRLCLMEDSLPSEGYDLAWVRWVACFVESPSRLVEKIAASLRPGGKVVFHEYADYASWRFAPRCPALSSFVEAVISSWRIAGGEPDVALDLPSLLSRHGLRVRSARPLVFAIQPDDYRWRWLAAFVRSNTRRLVELGQIGTGQAAEALRELQALEQSSDSWMTSPLVLEFVAQRPRSSA